MSIEDGFIVERLVTISLFGSSKGHFGFLDRIIVSKSLGLKLWEQLARVLVVIRVLMSSDRLYVSSP